MIIKKFRNLTQDIEQEDEKNFRLYLSYANKTFDPVRKQFGMVPVSNDSRKTKTILGDALELLSLAGVSQKRAREEYELSFLEWRHLGIMLLQECQSNEFDSDAFNRIKDIMIKGRHFCKSERCSSINKTKGLEADTVLVVAKTSNELKKWLTIAPDVRQNNKDDKCRLGYVAATRPRELLSFACLNPIDDEVRNLLTDRGITIVSQYS